MEQKIARLYSQRGTYTDGTIDAPMPFTRARPGHLFTTFAGAASVDEFDLDDLMLTARTVGEAYPRWLLRTTSDRRITQDLGAEAARVFYLDAFTAALWHRTATADERAERSRDFDAAIAEGLTPLEAHDLVLRGVLMSPHTVFRSEHGGPGGLSAHERVQLLAYGVAGAPPDAELLRTVEGDAILDEQVLRAQLRRLTSDPSKLPSLRAFLREYYGWGEAIRVSKDAGALFHAPARLIEDTEEVVASTLTAHARRGLFRALMTAPGSPKGSETHASWYGRNGNAQTAPGRSGVLMHPAWLVSRSEMDHNALVRRGRFVRERVLCTPVPSLPGGVVPPLSTAPGKSYRQRLEEQTAGAECRGCHQLMNDLGGAFEGFDHFGRPRTSDDGAPLDVSGVLDGLAGAPVPFDGPDALMRALADAPEAQDCFVENLFSYYVGRSPSPTDRCMLTELQAEYRTSGGDTLAVIESLFVWLATSPRVETP